MNDRSAGTFQGFGRFGQGTKRHLFLVHQAAVAEQHFTAVDDRFCAHAFPVVKGAGGVEREFFCAIKNGKRERVVRSPFNCVELGRLLERAGILEQDAVGRAESGADHHRHRCGQPEGIRTGNDEYGDGQRDREQQGRAEPPEPGRKGCQSDEDRDPHQPLRCTIGEQLRRCLGILRFLNQLDDLRERGVGANLRRPVLEAAAFVNRCTDDLVADRFADRHRLAR